MNILPVVLLRCTLRSSTSHHHMNPNAKAFFLAALVSSCFPALAGPCASLPYEELQDMTVQELTQEACTARKNVTENTLEAFDKRMSRYSPDPAGADLAKKEADRCDNESKRILRVLGKKGVETAPFDYEAACKPKKP